MAESKRHRPVVIIHLIIYFILFSISIIIMFLLFIYR